MKILSVDTCSKICNINLIEDGKVLKYLEIEDDITHAKKLLKGIDDILKETNTKLKDIDFFGCIIGPGSFTGIRIGVSTIKGFALALNKKVITATSMELLEENVRNQEEEKENKKNKETIITVIDARNDEVYASINKNNKRENFAGNIDDFVVKLIEEDENKEKENNKKEEKAKKQQKEKNKQKIYIVGTGKELFKKALNKKIKKEENEIIYIEDEKQRGRYLGFLMEKNIKNASSGENVMPLYLKPSGIKLKKNK